MPGHWIVVASADHVAGGVAGGFVQACHGRRAPLARMAPGDQIFCYSPVADFGGKGRMQAFTAMGTIAEGAPYQLELTGGVSPYRRDVIWTRTGRASIRGLLDRLDLTAGRQNWGMAFRAGLVRISARDAALIGVALSLAAATPRKARMSQRICSSITQPLARAA